MNKNVEQLLGNQLWFQRNDVAKIIQATVKQCIAVCENSANNSQLVGVSDGAHVCATVLKKQFGVGE